MKKIICAGFAILIVLALTVSAVGCGGEQNATTATTAADTSATSTTANNIYTSTEYGFTVEYPSDWAINDNIPDYLVASGAVAIFEGPEAPGYDYIAEIMIEAENLTVVATAEQYAASVETYILKKNLPNYTNIEEQKTTVGGQAALLRVFTATSSINTTSAPYKTTQIYFTKGEIGYVITYKAGNDIREQFYSAYNVVVSTFKF